MANKRFRIATEVFVLISRKVKNMNVKLVIISIILSATVWTLSKLVQPATREFSIAVHYVNPPDGLILLNHPDSVLNLELSAKGMEILTTTAGSQKTIPIDISSLKPRLKDGLYAASLPTMYFKKDLIRELNVNEVGNEMTPDSLHFVFDDLVEKVVPIRAQLDLQFKRSYSQKGEIRLTPDSVRITGPSSEIKGVEYIETVKEEYNKLDGTVDVLLYCQVPFSNVKLSHKEVVAHIEVDQFTESSFMVPVRVQCDVPGIEINTYPAEVEVSYLVALRDFEQVGDSSFVIQVDVDSLSLLRKDPLIPKIERAPDFVRNIRLSHETLDFVIIKE